MTMRYDAHKVSSNINGQVSGAVVGGTPVELGDNSRQKVRNLSALVTANLTTASLTLTAKWQVSNDGVSWVDVANGPQNAASVTFATAPSSASKAIPAPSAIYGWRKARIALITGGATGAAADTYALSYCYRAGA